MTINLLGLSIQTTWWNPSEQYLLNSIPCTCICTQNYEKRKWQFLWEHHLTCIGETKFKSSNCRDFSSFIAVGVDQPSFLERAMWIGTFVSTRSSSSLLFWAMAVYAACRTLNLALHCFRFPNFTCKWKKHILQFLQRFSSFLTMFSRWSF